jgi:hypothetical protein
MQPAVATDLDRFVQAVLLDIDAAGALADYLDEIDGPTAPYISGKPSPSRGTLLRRRWKMWRKDRDTAYINLLALVDAELPELSGYYRSDPCWESICIAGADKRFIAYIRSRFVPKYSPSRHFH